MGLGRSVTMVSERYNSGDRIFAGDGKCPKNNQEDDLDSFLEGVGPEISPLYMLQRAAQNGFIQSFKPTSTHEIYEKFGKRICEICDEHVDSEHSHKGCSLLILHQERKDELMAFVFHKERKDVHEESVKVDDEEQKVRELDNCKFNLKLRKRI